MANDIHDVTVSIAEWELKALIKAYGDLDEAGTEAGEFAAGVLGQVIVRLESKGKISGPSALNPDFTIH
jgi:hypothetical protein